MSTAGGVMGLTCWGAMVLGLVVVGTGCGAQLAAQPGRGADVRGAASLRRNQPQVLLVGPAWLLHVNNERREGTVGLAVYRAPRREGTVADCGRAGGALPAAAEPVDDPGRGPLYVRANEVVCAAAPKGARLSWHAQPLAAPDAAKEALASLQ